MHVVGHNDITQHIDIIAVYMIKPFVNSIIGIGDLEKREPFIARKGDKVNAIALLIMLKNEPA
jgi:hypothetical protein